MADPSLMVGCRKINCKWQRAEGVQMGSPLDYILNRVASGPSRCLALADFIDF